MGRFRLLLVPRIGTAVRDDGPMGVLSARFPHQRGANVVSLGTSR
jgi:hypothetical protein